MDNDPNAVPGSSPDGNDQQTTPGAQNTTTSAQAAPPAIPQGYVPEARLSGALQKIEQLTLTNKGLTDQLTAANTRIGELQAQSQVKDTEYSAKVGEGSQALQAVEGERDSLQTENKRLQAELDKAKLVGEMGHHNLLPILDQIPVSEDPEQQKAAIAKMATWADGLLQAREAALTAGNTTVVTQPATTVAGDTKLPVTAADWEKHIESLPYGSPERQAAWDNYWEVTQKPAAQ